MARITVGDARVPAPHAILAQTGDTKIPTLNVVATKYQDGVRRQVYWQSCTLERGYPYKYSHSTLF